MTHTTRESWLQAATLALEPILRDGGTGLTDVRVSCGWPARRALAQSNRHVGECWHAATNADGHGHIFISPCKDNPVEVLGILLHELTHAALPAKVKHGRAFAKAVHAMGLEGNPTATTVGEKLNERLNTEVLLPLGPYPHKAIDDSSTRPKQTTRLRLYECACPVKVRVASDTFDATCNVCSRAFVYQP